MKLKGKVAVVTGASKGIGAAIAEKLASEGAAVAVNYSSSASAAEGVVQRIQKNGGKAVAIKGDVSKSKDIENLFSTVSDKLGPVDILVNNAGIYEFRPIEQVDEEHIDRQFDLNVKGLLLASKFAVQAFRDRGGSIINISSIVAERAPAGSSAYAATKAAVNLITRQLSQEVGGRKIRVNAVSPGVTETEGTHASDETKGFLAFAPSKTVLGRVGQPDDISSVVAFLASDDARWVTGQIVGVDGGLAL